MTMMMIDDARGIIMTSSPYHHVVVVDGDHDAQNQRNGEYFYFMGMMMMMWLQTFCEAFVKFQNNLYSMKHGSKGDSNFKDSDENGDSDDNDSNDDRDIEEISPLVFVEREEGEALASGLGAPSFAPGDFDFTKRPLFLLVDTIDHPPFDPITQTRPLKVCSIITAHEIVYPWEMKVCGGAALGDCVSMGDEGLGEEGAFGEGGAGGDLGEGALEGLRTEYKNFKSSMNTRADVFDFTELTTMLIREEKSLGLGASSSQSNTSSGDKQAFYSNRGKGREQRVAQLAREKIKEALSRKGEEPVLEPTQGSPKRPRQEEEEEIEHIQADPTPPSPINIPPAPPSSPITPFPPASTPPTPPSPLPLETPKSPPAPTSPQQQHFLAESFDIPASLTEETAQPMETQTALQKEPIQPMEKIEEIKQTDGEQQQPTEVDVLILIVQEDEPTNKEAIQEVRSFDYTKLIQTLSRQIPMPTSGGKGNRDPENPSQPSSRRDCESQYSFGAGN
ncbi:hypothetical protein L7F22_006655 [Adiantum nelumboides]|nr:hypothetical protein [Adiantum nelumboides]